MFFNNTCQKNPNQPTSAYNHLLRFKEKFLIAPSFSRFLFPFPLFVVKYFREGENKEVGELHNLFIPLPIFKATKVKINTFKLRKFNLLIIALSVYLCRCLHKNKRIKNQGNVTEILTFTD